MVERLRFRRVPLGRVLASSLVDSSCTFIAPIRIPMRADRFQLTLPEIQRITDVSILEREGATDGRALRSSKA